MDDEENEVLHKRLIRLGDMIGDGLANEPSGKWIRKEYRQVAKALGIVMRKPAPLSKNPARTARAQAINERMVQRLAEFSCTECTGPLTQICSGSMKADCKTCNIRYTLLKENKK